MKNLNIPFENSEFKILKKAKKIHCGNWHDMFLDLSRKYISEEVKK